MPPPPKRVQGPLGPSLKAMNTVPQDQLLKVFYQTTSMREVPGRAPSAVCVGENFDNVHNVGRKQTRYLDFQQSRAPLLSRDACQSTRDFTPLPLGDCVVNRALATQFKGGLAMSQKGVDVPMDGWSIAETDWHDRDVEDMRRARPSGMPQSSQEPTQTLNGCGGLLETVSHTQRTLREPNMAIAKARREKKPDGNLVLGAKHANRLRTAYRAEFVPASPSMARAASTPELDGRGFPPLNHDPEISKVKRLPTMMPGR